MYNLNKLNPQWVAWELTVEETDGDIPRDGNAQEPNPIVFRWI